MRPAIIALSLLLAAAGARAEPTSTLDGMWQLLGACAQSVGGLAGSAGSEVTVLFSIKRDGSLQGQPRITHSKLVGDDAAQREFLAGAQDILLDGKERAANGKGVRAILHAAFKVAIMIHCHRRKLPHPGFVLLDTPLLTYREPMDVPRYGELEVDEAALKATSLDQRFYRHLARLAPIGQVIVLENSDPPEDIGDYATVTTFAKRSGPGQRYGFFPVAG
jgi:hypothetical protein